MRRMPAADRDPGVNTFTMPGSHDAAFGSVNSAQGDNESEQNSAQLGEVQVTGTRIKLTKGDAAPEVTIYSREQIDRVGQTTLTDFINTLPNVSVSSTENLFQNVAEGTSVTLRGVPVGTTLVR